MTNMLNDHARGCQGREYVCTCGYDEARDALVSYVELWNFDFDAAPRDGRQIIVCTTGDGRRIFVTRWMPPTNYNKFGRWDGFPENSKSILAWMPAPDHPNKEET